MDDGLCNDFIQHGTGNGKLYQYYISHCFKGNVGRIYHYCITCIFCIGSSRQNLCVPGCPAGRQTYFYHFCNTDLHRNMAGNLCQRTWGIYITATALPVTLSRITLWHIVKISLWHFHCSSLSWGLLQDWYSGHYLSETNIKDLPRKFKMKTKK